MGISKEPKVCRAHVGFEQEGNTLGTTEEVEEIDIFLEFAETEDEGPFYVIKTRGWSFDSLDDVQKLIDKANRVLNKEEEKV